jgi:hypothetical protein
LPGIAGFQVNGRHLQHGRLAALLVHIFLQPLQCQAESSPFFYLFFYKEAEGGCPILKILCIFPLLIIKPNVQRS